MDSIPSAEFRRAYARLIEPVAVTVNGHKIGEWWPSSIKDSENNIAFVPVPSDLRDNPRPLERGGIHQAERDAILRRINKGG